MNSKLEERLYLYERDHPIHSDQDLLAALEAILDEQDSFPVEQKDFDLISEATEFALQLQGYSDEQLTEMANASRKRILDRIHGKSIPAKRGVSKSRRSRLAWIILVAIVGALTITSVSASILGLNIIDATKKYILSLTRKASVTQNEKTLTRTDEIVYFDSIQDLARRYEDLNIETPHIIGEDYSSDIYSIDFGEWIQLDIKIEFSSPSNSALIEICIPTSIDNKLSSSDSTNRVQFTSLSNNEYLAEYSTENATYTITCNSYSRLKQIVNSMEVYHEKNN